MLIHSKGDLLAMAAGGDFDVIVHGCNCQNDMGGGIAAQIAKLYPAALEADTKVRALNESFPDMMLGNFSSVETDDGFIIINGYTQLLGGSGTFSYSALDLIFNKIVAWYPGSRIGLPYIGCGIAGGDQNIIVDMIEKFAIKVAVTGGSVTLVEFGV
jgi:O-acetyl-ADP-ribose deacetylase (regulator of RNase III)